MAKATTEKLEAGSSQRKTEHQTSIRDKEFDMSILLVTGIEGARNCATMVGEQLGMEVEVAEGRRAALAALRKSEFLGVVIDETLAECDPAAADRICEHAGLAIPLQINFAVSGAPRLVREIRSALHRREREQAVARRAAAAAIEAELKSTVAGLLLHSQLALSRAAECRPPVPIACAWSPIWPAACASS